MRGRNLSLVSWWPWVAFAVSVAVVALLLSSGFPGEADAPARVRPRTLVVPTTTTTVPTTTAAPTTVAPPTIIVVPAAPAPRPAPTPTTTTTTARPNQPVLLCPPVCPKIGTP